jgi:hypothetical protein
VLENCDIFLRGFRGQGDDPSSSLYGKFAGILQVEIRQWVFSVCMLVIMVWRRACSHACRTTQGTISRGKNIEGSPSNPVVTPEGCVWWHHKEAPGVADAMLKADNRILSVPLPCGHR